MAEHMSSDGIGKGCPPKSTRFKPGQSGNPDGRKKGRKNLKTIVSNVAHEVHSVGPSKLTTIALLLKRLQERASKGDLNSKTLLDEIRVKYEPETADTKPRGIRVPPVMSMEEFEKYAEALRAKHAWVQANREKIWKDMGLSD